MTPERLEELVEEACREANATESRLLAEQSAVVTNNTDFEADNNE